MNNPQLYVGSATCRPKTWQPKTCRPKTWQPQGRTIHSVGRLPTLHTMVNRLTHAEHCYTTVKATTTKRSTFNCMRPCGRLMFGRQVADPTDIGEPLNPRGTPLYDW